MFRTTLHQVVTCTLYMKGKKSPGLGPRGAAFQRCQWQWQKFLCSLVGFLIHGVIAFLIRHAGAWVGEGTYSSLTQPFGSSRVIWLATSSQQNETSYFHKVPLTIINSKASDDFPRELLKESLSAVGLSLSLFRTRTFCPGGLEHSFVD